MEKEILTLYTEQGACPGWNLTKRVLEEAQRYYRSASGANEIRSDFHKQSG